MNFYRARCRSNLIRPVSPEEQEGRVHEGMGDGNDHEREEAAEVKVKREEHAPSQQETNDHMPPRMLFRSLCPFCIAGDAVSAGHHNISKGPRMGRSYQLTMSSRGGKAK